MLAGLAGRLQRCARPVGACGAGKVVTLEPRPILLKGAGSHRVLPCLLDTSITLVSKS